MVANTCKFCGHESPAQSKFCGECGAAFQVVCRFCEHSNPAGSQFCNQCGGQMNLLPCPRCGAVSGVTATSCYQCHSQLPGDRSEALDFPFPTNDEFSPSSGQDSDIADEEAAFAEIKKFYDSVPPRGTDDPGRPSHNENFRPLPLQHSEGTDEATRASGMAQFDDRLAPHRAGDRVRSAPATGADSAVPRRFSRTIVATAILAVIAAVSYYEYHERSLGDAIKPPDASSEQLDRDGSGAGNVPRNMTDLKTLPARSVQGAAEPVAGKTALTSAGLVPGFPEFALAPALKLPGAVNVEKAIPAPDEAAAASANLAPEMP